jgi:hypothetical protein
MAARAPEVPAAAAGAAATEGGRDKEKDEVYMQRNHLFQMAVIMARAMHFPAGIRKGTETSAWPILFIVLPDEGEISIHCAKSDIIFKEGDIPGLVVERQWDGSTDDDKIERITSFIARWMHIELFVKGIAGPRQ